VTLDDPFCDVLVKLEDLGNDFEVDDDGLMASSRRSGDSVRLGERIMVEVTDCAILRRTVYARRIGGERSDGDGERRFRGGDDSRRGRTSGTTRAGSGARGAGSSSGRGDGRGRGPAKPDGKPGERDRGAGARGKNGPASRKGKGASGPSSGGFGKKTSSGSGKKKGKGGGGGKGGKKRR
jgi:ribonuclease R